MNIKQVQRACRHIARIRGVGPNTAIAVVAAICDGLKFKNGWISINERFRWMKTAWPRPPDSARPQPDPLGPSRGSPLPPGARAQALGGGNVMARRLAFARALVGRWLIIKMETCRTMSSTCAMARGTGAPPRTSLRGLRRWRNPLRMGIGEPRNRRAPRRASYIDKGQASGFVCKVTSSTTCWHA
jgi:hypothetical protein